MRIKKKTVGTDKGFTLAELLIVVGIIAVLVAISIPSYIIQLEKTKEYTDIANLRSAKVKAVTSYFGNEIEAETVYYYDPYNGELSETKPEIPCGQGTTVAGNGVAGANLAPMTMARTDYEPPQTWYTTSTAAVNKHIAVIVHEDSSVELSWVE